MVITSKGIVDVGTVAVTTKGVADADADTEGVTIKGTGDAVWDCSTGSRGMGGSLDLHPPLMPVRDNEIAKDNKLIRTDLNFIFSASVGSWQRINLILDLR
jgi:hypothetical protein